MAKKKTTTKTAELTAAQQKEMVTELSAALQRAHRAAASGTILTGPEVAALGAKPRLSESAAARMWRAAKPTPGCLRERLRAQFLPWRVFGLVLAAGVVQEAAAAVSATSLLVIALGSATTAAGALVWLRTARARAAERTRLAAEWVAAQRGHARTVAVCAVVWAIALHLIGPATAAAWAQILTLSVIGFLLLSARFWQHHRPQRTPAATTDTTPPPPPAEGEHPLARKWRTRVASGGGVLPKSKMLVEATEDFGVSGRIQLVGGKQDLEMVRASATKLATALGVSADNLLFERIAPTKDEPNPDPAVITFKAITASAIVEAVPMQGPQYLHDGEDGHMPIGPYADGDGAAKWRLYSQDSIWGGYVVGAIGSGKSGLLDRIALAAWESGHTVVFYIDGAKAGGASPRIYERATWALGDQPDQWEAMAKGLETLVKVRGAENRRRLGTSGFTPSPQRPGVLVILDESHKIVTNKTAKRWGNIVREGRSSGVGVVMASQIFGLESFGGDDAVRSSICKGNTVALNIGRNQAGIMDFPLNPAKLPKDQPGLGLVDVGREATFRAAYAGGAEMAAAMDAALEHAAELDPLAAGALDQGSDGAFARRHEIQAEADADLDAMLEAIEAGLAAPVRRAAPPAAEEPGEAGGVLAPPSLDPALLQGVDLSILTASRRASWSGVHAAILDLLAEGPVRRGDIDAAVKEDEGVSRATVSRALDTLAEAGEIAPVEGQRGVWRRR